MFEKWAMKMRVKIDWCWLGVTPKIKCTKILWVRKAYNNQKNK